MEVEIPDLELCRAAHSAIIATEAAHHFRWALRDRRLHTRLGPDVRVAFAASELFTAGDYVQALCIRRRMAAHMAAVYERADVIATPTVPCGPPRLHAAALRCGESNLALTSSLMKFMQLANLLGTPAVTVPTGLDAEGLPLGCAAPAAATAPPCFARCILVFLDLQLVWVKTLFEPEQL